MKESSSNKWSLNGVLSNLAMFLDNIIKYQLHDGEEVGHGWTKFIKGSKGNDANSWYK